MKEYLGFSYRWVFMSSVMSNCKLHKADGKLNPLAMADWEIAEAAEKTMKSIGQVAADLGLHKDELIPMGNHLGKVDAQKVLKRLNGTIRGKYIDVTAITPTPLGEGKTTTTLGLVEGLGYLGKKAVGAIRQPSGGPTFNIKRSEERRVGKECRSRWSPYH